MVVLVWSGGCGSRRAAKSSGAQVVACRGGFVLRLLWRCIYSVNDYAFDSEVVCSKYDDLYEVACVEEVWM